MEVSCQFLSSLPDKSMSKNIHSPENRLNSKAIVINVETPLSKVELKDIIAHNS